MGRFSYASIVVWLMATSRRCMMRKPSSAREKAAENTKQMKARMVLHGVGMGWGVHSSKLSGCRPPSSAREKAAQNAKQMKARMVV